MEILKKDEGCLFTSTSERKELLLRMEALGQKMGPVMRKEVVERMSGCYMHAFFTGSTIESSGAGQPVQITPSELRKRIEEVERGDIKVGDTVEVLVNNPSGSYWMKGDRFVVLSSDTYIVGQKPGRGTTTTTPNHVRKVPRVIDDDVIRVGDTVERVEGEHGGMDVGDRATVKSVGPGPYDLGLKEYPSTHDIRKFKKIKSGSDSTPATNTQQSDEVRREPQGEGHGCGQGKAVAAHGRQGQVANAGRLAGNAVTPRVGAGGVRGAEVLFSALRPEAQ